jgi:hypothetical protein
MREEALASNLVSAVHICWALNLWLFWLRLTVIIVSDGDHSWWFSTMLALACVVGPLLGVLLVHATGGGITCFHIRSLFDNIGGEQLFWHIPFPFQGSEPVCIDIVVITDWLRVWAWLRTWNGLKVDVQVCCASILTITSMGGVDKTILVSKVIIICVA